MALQTPVGIGFIGAGMISEQYLANLAQYPDVHVVILGENTVLMAASAPMTAQQLRDRGLQVITVDISEYEKLEGCVTCLSVRLRG